MFGLFYCVQIPETGGASGSTSGRTVLGPAAPGPAVLGLTVPGPAVLGLAVPGPAVPGRTAPGPAVRGPAAPGLAMLGRTAPVPIPRDNSPVDVLMEVDSETLRIFKENVMDPLMTHNFYLPLCIANIVGPLGTPKKQPEPPQPPPLRPDATPAEKKQHAKDMIAWQSECDKRKISNLLLELYHEASMYPTVRNIYRCCWYTHEFGRTAIYEPEDPSETVENWDELEGKSGAVEPVEDKMGNRTWLSVVGEAPLCKLRQLCASSSLGFKVDGLLMYFKKEKQLYTGCIYGDMIAQQTYAGPYATVSFTTALIKKKGARCKFTHIRMAANPYSSMMLSIAAMINIAAGCEELKGFTRLFAISHSCHNSLCINRSHFNLEMILQNVSRQKCASISKCICGSLDRCFPWAPRGVLEYRCVSA